MNFEGMTPQQAAECITSSYVIGSERDKCVAEACEHFRAVGVTEARSDEDKEAMAIIREAAAKICNPQKDVRAFMEAFGQPLPTTPQWPDQETMDLRVRLKAEEFCEWLRDSGYIFNVRVLEPYPYGMIHVVYDNNAGEFTPRSLPKSADALIDDLYVTIGTLLAMGIDMWPLWKAVQRANMAKIGGPVVNGKQMKPDGWTPPDIEGELRKQGWEGE